MPPTKGGTVDGLKSALETSKQVIALSTGALTITVTFIDKIVQPGETEARFPGPLKGGWIAFGIAMFFAVWTLMAITGTLNALDRKAHGLELTEVHKRATESLAEGSNIRIPAFLMLLSFFFAALLTIATGFWL